MRKFIILGILLLLSACTSFEYAPPPPTPQRLHVIYSPALAWMQESLHQCAVDTPGLALTVEVRAASMLHPEAGALTLRLGSAPDDEQHQTYLLGYEELVVFAHPDIPPSQLEAIDVAITFRSLEPAYQAWTYPPGDEIRAAFDAFLLAESGPSPHVKIAPNPNAMLDVVTNQTNSIGYATQHWARSDVQSIPLGSESRLPILALTVDEPQGLMRSFIVCLQASLP